MSHRHSQCPRGFLFCGDRNGEIEQCEISGGLKNNSLRITSDESGSEVDFSNGERVRLKIFTTRNFFENDEREEDAWNGIWDEKGESRMRSSGRPDEMIA